MPNIEDFMDGVMAEFRGRLALLGDSGDRRAIEDGIALLMAYRRGDMDVARFEMLLSTLRSGRCPDGLSVLRPQLVGEEIGRRWAAARRSARSHADPISVAGPGGVKAPRLLQPID
jgi:hypothetical protein